MKNLLPLLFLVFLPLTANAAPRLWGIDQLGGAKYRNTLIAHHPEGFALGIFTQKELFGDAYPVVDELLAKKRIPLVRYNLRWSDTHTFTRADFPKIVAEARRLVPLVNKYPATECEFAGAVEHKLDAANAQLLANQVLAAIPERCRYVNTPWIRGGGKLIAPTTRIKNELHGKDARAPQGAHNFSFDGDAAEDSNVEALKSRFANSDVFFFWGPRNNGRWESNDSTPRPQRKGYPDGDYIKSLAALSRQLGAPTLPKNWLYKSHAENKGNGDSRAEKPVVIIPLKAKEIKVGETTCRYYGPFEARHRYYCPQWGYKIANGTTNVTANGKTYGSVNPAFRQGEFR